MPTAEPSVWAVHTVQADEVRPTDMICSNEPKAIARALDLSQDDEVLAAVVVRYVLDRSDTRSPVAMFRDGKRQQVPYVSDDRTVSSSAGPPR